MIVPFTIGRLWEGGSKLQWSKSSPSCLVCVCSCACGCVCVGVWVRWQREWIIDRGEMEGRGKLLIWEEITRFHSAVCFGKYAFSNATRPVSRGCNLDEFRYHVWLMIAAARVKILTETPAQTGKTQKLACLRRWKVAGQIFDICCNEGLLKHFFFSFWRINMKQL